MTMWPNGFRVWEIPETATDLLNRWDEDDYLDNGDSALKRYEQRRLAIVNGSEPVPLDVPLSRPRIIAVMGRAIAAEIHNIMPR